MYRRYLLALFIVLYSLAALAADTRWSERKANDWYRRQPWLVGANYVPASAINQLEMWQADTFDPRAIDREFAWAEQAGFNTMRVFLHNLLWQQDAKGFLQRMDQFLGIAARHHIRIAFVLFDSVWDPNPKLGRQRDPRPRVHNSGWMQAPGRELLSHPERWDAELKPYVTGVISQFRDDRRVLMWDLMNEPDNSDGPPKDLANKAEAALQLLTRTWAWARAARPSQPLTSGVWDGDWSNDAKLSAMQRFQLDNSDVITFHNYGPLPAMQQSVASLERFHRPILCTEYMARTRGSTFQAILPFLHEKRIAAYNWGLVSGKTNTIYPWDSWQKQYTSEPSPWFHDVFRPDGTPYDPAEVALIRRLTGRAGSSARR